MTRTLRITETQDILKTLNVLLGNDSAVTPDAIKKYGKEIITAIEEIPASQIAMINNIKIAQDDGQKAIPTAITIYWTEAEILVRARDYAGATEELIRRLVDDRLRAELAATHHKLATGHLYDKETVDELRRQRDIANTACTTLHMQIAEERSNSAAKGVHMDLRKQAAEPQPPKPSRVTVSIADAYETLSKIDINICRRIFQSAVRMFSNECEDLHPVPAYDLAPYHFNGKPAYIKNYVHTTLDNMIQAGTVSVVTRQMMLGMFNEACLVNREKTMKSMLAISHTGDVRGIGDADIERVYKALRDMVNSEDEVRT